MINRNRLLAPILIFVVDDDVSTRMIASEFLTQSGFEVASAEDGQTAMESIDEIQPDIILLDVEMPGINGFEVCTILRARQAYTHTPILMLTGLDNEEIIDRAYVAGATDFATKPINWSLLSHRLRYIHRGSLLAAQLIREQNSLAVAQRIAQLGNWQYDYNTETTEWSDQLYRILGMNPKQVVPSPAVMLEFVAPEDFERVTAWVKNAKHLTQPSSIDHLIVLGDGSIRNVRQQIEPVVDNNGKTIRLQAIVQDVTDRQRVEDKVRQLAYYDTLTNLPNRASFHELLDNSLLEAKKNNRQLAILYFDLDDFKLVNDSFGHEIGDRLLKEVGARLTDCLLTLNKVNAKQYHSNKIARMGGDEFTILLTPIQAPEDAEQVAQSIIEALSHPFRFDGYELFSSPSIGIALYPRDAATKDTLLKNADMAMYEAKRFGKNGYKIHDAQMDARAEQRFLIDAQMRTALERKEFCVHYQPQIDLNTGTIFSVEALLRWNNEKLGFVSPVEFIPIAEENGLIVPIGEWVLRSACKQLKQWLNDGYGIQKVAVNISAVQFMRSDFTSTVSLVLDETALPAEHLELEITESLLASDTARAVNLLNELNKRGVQLSIDDFGTGYSSLSQLKHFPIDRLKIDQSFIREVTENADDAAITRAVIAMAGSMNIQVLAEGVETLEHLEFLRENNCDEVQGFFISKPLSAEDLEANMPELQRCLGALFHFDNERYPRKAS